tara:strand:+ start:230 stop:493 length:264 start_codon:yes stop_codon:yes gene_type:complete
MKGMSFGNSPLHQEKKKKKKKTIISIPGSVADAAISQEGLDAAELKKRQDKRQQYMINDRNIWNTQDEIDKADIKSKRGKIKGKDYY